MNFRKDYFLIGFAAILLFAQQSTLKACGLSEDVPATHFPGVDSYGNVRYWDKVADIDLGGGLVMPLSMGFASDWSQSSPYLGYGWALPLLDSHIVQKDEYSFEVLQPDGYTRPFLRDNKDSMVLSGGPGWMGKVEGDHTITLWASCGWKLVYKEGKIVSMSTPKGKTLTFERDASGAVTEITEGTLVLLKVEQDYPTVKITLENQGGIQGPGGEKTIVLTQVEKPRIEIVDGTNAVAATDWSLGRAVVNGDEAQAKTFSYAPTESLQPEITIKNGADVPSRQIVWNTTTHFIVSDGEWTYKITPATQKGYKAAIDRKNAQGGEEFWHQDDAMGQETTLILDGTKIVKTWFTSGVLAGRIRNIFTYNKSGLVTSFEKNSYDDNGEVLRKKTSNQNITFSRANNITKIVSTPNKEKVAAEDKYKYSYTKIVDQSNSFTITFSDQRTDTYDSLGRIIERRYKDRLEKIYYLDEATLIITQDNLTGKNFFLNYPKTSKNIYGKILSANNLKINSAISNNKHELDEVKNIILKCIMQ